AGEVGEIYTRNGMLTRYHRHDRVGGGAAALDGFVSVGDLGHLDRDGYLYIDARTHDMVIAGGVNIYPCEIEDVLHSHPQVLEAAVVGIPDDEWGESLKAFVIRQPGAEPSAGELATYCRQHLANYKCPKHFAFVDALPRNSTGKVLKRE